MKRTARRILIALLATDVVVAVFLVGALFLQPSLLIDLRNLFTISVVEGDGLFRASPAELREAGFQVDGEPELVRRRVDWMRRELSYLDEPLPADRVARARDLVLRFSRNGGGDCGAFKGLEDLLQRIGQGEGHGCCSDHSEALIALGHAVDLTVREVSNTRHVFNEVYLPGEARWVWIDPQYALLAKGPDGHYLSLLELRDAYLHGELFELEFFGTPHHELHGRDPRTLHYYDEPEDFADLWMTWGNNVLEADAFYSALSLTRSVTQPVGLLAGQLPRQVMMRDANSVQAHTHAWWQRFGIAVVILLAGGPVLAFAVWLVAPAPVEGGGRRQRAASLTPSGL